MADVTNIIAEQIENKIQQESKEIHQKLNRLKQLIAELENDELMLQKFANEKQKYQKFLSETLQLANETDKLRMRLKEDIRMSNNYRNEQDDKLLALTELKSATNDILSVMENIKILVTTNNTEIHSNLAQRISRINESSNCIRNKLNDAMTDCWVTTVASFMGGLTFILGLCTQNIVLVGLGLLGFFVGGMLSQESDTQIQVKKFNNEKNSWTASFHNLFKPAPSAPPNVQVGAKNNSVTEPLYPKLLPG